MKTTFFILWLIVGTDRFPYQNYETEKECIKVGTQSGHQFRCTKW